MFRRGKEFNAIEQAVVLSKSEEVTVDDLGLHRANPDPQQKGRLISLDAAEKQHIDYVLEAVKGNKTRACQILGIGRGTL